MKKEALASFFMLHGTWLIPHNAQLVTRTLYFSFTSISKQRGVYSGIDGELPVAP